MSDTFCILSSSICMVKGWTSVHSATMRQTCHTYVSPDPHSNHVVDQDKGSPLVYKRFTQAFTFPSSPFHLAA